MRDDIFAQATAPCGDPSPASSALLVFAHPDDEVIAVGARFRRFRSAHLITVTDGAPRNGVDSRAHGFHCVDDYRLARANELRHALSTAGFRGSCRTFDIPDQQAALALPELVRRLRQVIAERCPQVVFTHPYEGGHPDHDACAVAVHAAVALAEHSPMIIESAFYHAGPAGTETETFLPPPHPVPEVSDSLSQAERGFKQALLDCFATQRETLRGFSLDYERYRVAPQYDFEAPPHAGQLLFEKFPWGMTADRFCELARQAAEPLCG